MRGSRRPGAMSTLTFMPAGPIKLTRRLGSAVVEGLNEALLAEAAGQKLLRVSRVRADTTVVPANVAYPTDSGLLARAIRRIAATGRRIQAAGGARRTRVRDRSRAAGRRAHAIAAKLRSRAAQAREDKQAMVSKMTGELAGQAAAGSRRLLGNARRALRRAEAQAAALTAAGLRDAAAGRLRGRLRRAVNDLAALLETTRTITAQARQRIAGDMPGGATRQVSLHDGDARPIAKGRLGKPVEFGYKAQVTDNDDGIISTTSWSRATPPTAPSSPPPWRASSSGPGRSPGPSPPTAATARNPSKTTCTHSESATSRSAQGQTRQGPPGRRTPARVPAGRQMAHRQRRPDCNPQTPVRLGPHPPGRNRRSPHLGRLRDPGPQPGQDQRPDHLNRPAAKITNDRQGKPQTRSPARRLFQVEVASYGDTSVRSGHICLPVRLQSSRRCHCACLRSAWRPAFDGARG